ncbi:MAG: protein translocase subunit SecD [bacterium]
MIKTRAIAFFLLLGAAVVGYATYHFSAFKFGLDLAGGTHLVYQADVSQVPASEVSDSMNALRDVIERRVNVFGVSEPIVQIQGGSYFSSKGSENQLIVELPGVTDVNAAIKNIGETPSLDFRLLLASTSKAIQANTSMTDQEKAAAMDAAFMPVGLNGRMLKRAQIGYNPTTGAAIVSITFNAEGTALFASTTKANIGNILGIFLDGANISLPVIQEPILDGTAQISGNFTTATAQTLVRNLNYGALPVPIQLLSTQTIGASLGQRALDGGVRAGVIAFIVIAIFLVVWYRLPGLVAVVSLGAYTCIVLALFKLIPVTLTAAGIAGFILSVGMAVDANILIFERTKEELRKGTGVALALHEGFARAWPSIRDSNTSSIITGVILYYFGSTSVVTGFALVFVVGVVVSMFTAITASRMFLFAISPQAKTGGNGRIARFLFSNGFHFKK